MEEKSREEILAERKSRKAAKQNKKKGAVTKNSDETGQKNVDNADDLSKKLDQVKISEKPCDSSSLPKNKVPATVTPSPTDSPSLNSVSKPTKSIKIPTSAAPSPAGTPSADAVSIATKPVNIQSKSSSIPAECKQSQNAPKSIEESSQQSFSKEVTVAESENVKSKSQLKAERRAKQEAQRALKAQKKNEIAEPSEPSPKVEHKAPVPKSKPKSSKPAADPHKVKVFSHLYRNSSVEESKILAACSTVIHKSVVKLGIQYKEKIIIGGNARVIAFLNALKQVIADYKTPAEKDFSRGFEIVLQDTVQYLNNCRPISVSIENAVKYIKLHLAALHSESNFTDQQARDSLRARIDQYMKEEIDKAGEAICIMVQKKISENDVILTFGYSSLIERILNESFKTGIKFRVIIVDTGPLFEGKELLRRLVKSGLHCVYVLLAATSYIMKEATKVLLGAHAILTNGYVMSRAGSSQVALIANSYNVPVLVCCETHKFSERVQTDAFVYNELGDPGKLMKTDVWRSNVCLTPLTLMYDVTPSDLVTAVVTELAILPCTSVPVILRVKPAQPAYPLLS